MSQMGEEIAVSSEEDRVLLETGKTKKPSSLCTRKFLLNAGTLLVLILLAVAVVVPVVLSKNSTSSSEGVPYGLENMTAAGLAPRSYSLVWTPNSDMYIHRESGVNGTLGDYVLLDPAHPDITTGILISNSSLEYVNASSAVFSADLQYALLLSNVEFVYRHSFNATYHLYHQESEAITPFTGVSSKQIQYVGWSSTGHSLVFVQDGDIYLQSDLSSDPVPVTADGSDIIDGIPDWVYEEEVLSSNHALWWSSNSSFLCYVSFNDTPVLNFPFPHYGDYIYDEIYSVPYPKAGFPNPTVTVTVVNVENPTEKFNVPAPVDEVTNEHIVQQITWGNDSTFAVVWMNRVQNKSVTQLCDALTQECRLFYTNENPNGWVTVKPILFSSNADRYVTILSRPFESDSFPQIAIFNVNENTGTPVFITSGDFTVDVISVFSDEENFIYYTSTETKNGSSIPRQRHLWKTSVEAPQEKTCIACNGTCGYVSASFSYLKGWYSMTCHGPDVPVYSLVETATTLAVVVEDNSELKDNLDKIRLPKIEYFQLKTESVPQGLSAAMILPPDFDSSTKYPVFFDVYGGPGYQKVTEAFSLSWRTYIASSLDIIVVMIDGRGSCCQGDNFMQTVYRQLGRFEPEDVIESARALKKDRRYVDPDRFGAWGWSYGGYLTSMVVASGSGEFKTAIAVAPVTSWKYYDSVYTERYNGLPTPEDNGEAYERYSVMNGAANFSGVDYLLIHGTGDDNVHFQNTAQLVKSLTEAGMEYQVQFYTDKQHGLRGQATQKHLYKLMSKFLKNSFSID